MNQPQPIATVDQIPPMGEQRDARVTVLQNVPYNSLVATCLPDLRKISEQIDEYNIQQLAEISGLTNRQIRIKQILNMRAVDFNKLSIADYHDLIQEVADLLEIVNDARLQKKQIRIHRELHNRKILQKSREGFFRQVWVAFFQVQQPYKTLKQEEQSALLSRFDFSYCSNYTVDTTEKKLK